MISLSNGSFLKLRTYSTIIYSLNSTLLSNKTSKLIKLSPNCQRALFVIVMSDLTNNLNSNFPEMTPSILNILPSKTA